MHACDTIGMLLSHYYFIHGPMSNYKIIIIAIPTYPVYGKLMVFNISPWAYIENH